MCEDANWVHLVQGTVQRRVFCEHGVEPSGYIKCW